MTLELHDLLGIDPESPEVAQALEDAEEYASLVECLVVARVKLGLTQKQIAERMGTTQSAVSNFERVGGDARYSTLQRYARAVGARVRSAVDQSGAGVKLGWQVAEVVPIRTTTRDRHHSPSNGAWQSYGQRRVST